MHLWFVPALLFIIPTAQAQTNDGEPTPVSVTSLRLVGKGMENRKTGERMALVCWDEEGPSTPDCKSLRFVYFNPEGQGHYIGDLIYVSDTHDTQRSNIRHTFKKWMKQFRRYRADHRRIGPQFHDGIIALGFIGVEMLEYLC